MKADVVRTVISYINGEDISIAWDDITDFIDIAELWQLVQVKDNVEDNIVINVDPDTNNCIHWMDIAEKYHIEKLQGKILNLDACTKLRVCLHVIQNDDASSTSNYMDSLHRFQLTQCTPAFIEVVLKKTFRKAKRAQVKPYTDMLLRVCREKTVETDNEESASFSDVPADNSLITNDRHVYLCGNTRSSVSINKVSDGKSYVNYNYKTQIRQHKIITRRSNRMIYTFGFRPDANTVCVTRICKHPPENVLACMTPYGLFSHTVLKLDQKHSCTLSDVSSPNCICLPARRRIHTDRFDPIALYMNARSRVYILYPYYTLKLRYLDLQKPKKWHSEPRNLESYEPWADKDFPASRRETGHTLDAYAVGSNICLIHIHDSHVLTTYYYSTIINAWCRYSSYKFQG